MSAVFRIEVANAQGERSGWAKLYAKVKRAFFGFQVRFRISEAPVLPKPSPWTEPAKLDVPKEMLELLGFRPLASDELLMIGQNLARSIFQDRHIDLFARSITTVKNAHQDQVLRVLFSYDGAVDPSVKSIPWECLFYTILVGPAQHFGLSGDLGVARLILQGDLDTYQPLKIEKKLRVLAVAPNPKTCVKRPLKSEAELKVISEIATQHSKGIELHTLPKAGWLEFKRELARVDPHILFFIGHGGFVGNEPHLFFQRAASDECEPISIAELANTLSPHSNLRLAILAACQTAVTRSPFANAAEQLLEAGIPAVIAMQSKVEDSAATEFGFQFFQYLFQQKYSLDTCINAGRMAMLSKSRTTTEWAIPVLYLSTRHDQIFDFGSSADVDSEESIKQTSMEEKFPLTVEPFIPRPTIRNELKLDADERRLTVISGAFGAGKTQIISSFCIEMIRAHAPYLFFYLHCRDDWSKFEAVLVELDRQSQRLGFQGFKTIINDTRHFGEENSIKLFSELLAMHNLVIVFDDYVWDGAEFWHELFIQLANHLRRSKVFVITTFPQHADEGQQSFIEVGGFLPSEVQDFFSDLQLDADRFKELMEVASQAGYLPWYLKRMKQESKPREKLKVPRAQLVAPELEKEVLFQLSVLRKPVTLNVLAMMLAPDDPADYLEAALRLQGRAMLTFTRNLGVELSKELQNEFLSQLGEDERRHYHNQAAVYYAQRANEISRQEQLFHEAKSRENQ
jgi:CHAT domain-containing protein